MKLIYKSSLFLFFIFLTTFSVFSYQISKSYLEKMKKVESALGFTAGYTPKYFTSPADYVNVLNNNKLHFKNMVYTAKNSPVAVSPVKIAWDEYIGKDENGKEVAPDYAIIVIPGSAGSYIQFAELMYDMQKASGQKIAFFMMDNRGQGLSTWFNPNNEKGFNGLYVDHFSKYVRDLKHFYGHIVRPKIGKLEKEYNKKIPVFAFGHSLGGGIIAKYIEFLSHDFNGVILSSPAIKALSWPKRPLAHWATSSIIKQGGGSYYIPTGYSFHEPQLFNSVFCQTSNKDRFYYWQKVQDPGFFENEKLIHPNSGGEVLRMSYPTYWWTTQLIEGTNSLSDSGHASRVRTPYIILQAGNDQLVSLEAMFEYLKNTPWGIGKIIKFTNSNHDIMYEKKSIRDRYITEILEFLKSYSSERHYLYSLGV